MIITRKNNAMIITPKYSAMIITPKYNAMIITRKNNAMIITPKYSAMIITPKYNAMIITPKYSAMIITRIGSRASENGAHAQAHRIRENTTTNHQSPPARKRSGASLDRIGENMIVSHNFVSETLRLNPHIEA